ncbi:unnamed protein product [Caenorhabditis auriculariae]|uniref:Uncharacterized protein n=1 Tax=Caenorhabditis auriculariae TaxID=2777116 RepID=A0A8S1GW64_9PELO|nr:unnamed protein product [Caenorhabditis auriculariae]
MGAREKRVYKGGRSADTHSRMRDLSSRFGVANAAFSCTSSDERPPIDDFLWTSSAAWNASHTPAATRGHRLPSVCGDVWAFAGIEKWWCGQTGWVANGPHRTPLLRGWKAETVFNKEGDITAEPSVCGDVWEFAKIEKWWCGQSGWVANGPHRTPLLRGSRAETVFKKCKKKQREVGNIAAEPSVCSDVWAFAEIEKWRCGQSGWVANGPHQMPLLQKTEPLHHQSAHRSNRRVTRAEPFPQSDFTVGVVKEVLRAIQILDPLA